WSPSTIVIRSVSVTDRQFLCREQRDYAAALVGYDHFFLDARSGIAVSGRTIGFQREHHAFFDLGRMIGRKNAGDGRTLGQVTTEPVAALQPKARKFIEGA